MMSAHTAAPSHVPPERAVDVNIFDLPGGGDGAQFAWKALSRHGDLISTPCHGGHWIAASGELIERIYRDPKAEVPRFCEGE